MTLIYIFLVLTKQATGTGGSGSTAFSINGDTVKQANTEESWISPSSGLHINEAIYTFYTNYGHSQTDAVGPRQQAAIESMPHILYPVNFAFT